MFHDRPGLDVNPPPKPSDRYYDDNAWICLSLLDAYELTHDPEDLSLATDAYRFTMSGRDETLGGGIYWHEDQTASKNACSSGPAMLAALSFISLPSSRITLTPPDNFTTGRVSICRIQTVWCLIHSCPERVDWQGEVYYNSATLLRAACLLYQITGDKSYIDEARRIAARLREKIRPSRGRHHSGRGNLG